MDTGKSMNSKQAVFLMDGNSDFTNHFPWKDLVSQPIETTMESNGFNWMAIRFQGSIFSASWG